MQLVGNRLAERFPNVYIVQEDEHWIIELLISADVFNRDKDKMKRGVLTISRRLWRYIDTVRSDIDENGNLVQPDGRLVTKVLYKPFMR